MFRLSSLKSLPLAALLASGALGAGSVKTMNASVTSSKANREVAAAQAASHATSGFKGVKANTGHATHSTDTMGRSVLTLSDDFNVPDAPAPHWQVIDSRGNAYLFNRLVIKGDKFNKTLTLPPYVQDVAKVQIWCAYAEVLLGEASFASPVR